MSMAILGPFDAASDTSATATPGFLSSIMTTVTDDVQTEQSLVISFANGAPQDADALFGMAMAVVDGAVAPQAQLVTRYVPLDATRGRIDLRYPLRGVPAAGVKVRIGSIASTVVRP